MRADRLELVRRVPGFMPAEEGLALHEAGRQAATLGPLLEIGSWCGRSAMYLGDAAEQAGTVLFCVDHHRGSEENQVGWEHHDPALVEVGCGSLRVLRRAGSGC